MFQPQLQALQRRRKPSSDVSAPQPLPRKEYGLWNFLTWSFFLSQVLAVEAFVGSAAKAAESADLHAAGGVADDAGNAASSDPTLGFVHATPDESAPSFSSVTEPISSNPSLVADAANPLAPANANEAGGGDAAQRVSLDGAAGDAASQVQGSASGAAGDPPPATLSELLGDGGHSGGLLSPIIDGVSHTVETVVGQATHAVGDLVGEVLHVADGAATQIVGPLLGTVEDVVHTVSADVLAPVEALTASTIGAASALAHDLVTTADAVLDGAVGALGDAFDAITAGTGELAHDALASAGTLLQGVSAAGGDLAHDLVGTASDVTSGTTAAASALLGTVADAAGELTHDATGDLGQLGQGTLSAADGGVHDALASAGSIVFPDAAPSTDNNLFAGGRYTDYGLQMHDMSSDAGLPGAAKLVSGIASDATAAIDHVLHSTPDPDADHAGHGLASHGGVLSGLETALRGLGDGIT